MTSSTAMTVADLVKRAFKTDHLQTSKTRKLTKAHRACIKRAKSGTSLSVSDRYLGISLARAVVNESYRNPNYLFHKLSQPAGEGRESVPTFSFTQCSAGYIYFEGISVEHYSYDRTPEGSAREAESLDNLMAQCLKVLDMKCVVNSRTAICDILKNAPLDMTWRVASMVYYCFFEKDGLIACIFNKRGGEGVFSQQRQADGTLLRLEHAGAYEAFHEYEKAGWTSRLAQGNFEFLNGCFERLGIADEQIAEESGYDYLAA